MLHPNMKFRGNAIKELIEKSGFEKEQIIVCETNTMGAMCARKVNEALLYRCHGRVPDVCISTR